MHLKIQVYIFFKERAYTIYSLVLEYIVEVHTGSEAGADSEVNVHAQIFGTRGDTGVRKLLKSVDSSEDLFTAGKVGG